MGTFSNYEKVYTCDQKSLRLCSVVKCLAFLKCFRRWGSKYFSNFKKSPPLWWHFFIFSISHMESSPGLLLTHTTCSDGAFGLLQNASLLDSEQETRFHLLCISSPTKNSLLKTQQLLWINPHFNKHLSSSNKNDSTVKTAQKTFLTTDTVTDSVVNLLFGCFFFPLRILINMLYQSLNSGFSISA